MLGELMSNGVPNSALTGISPLTVCQELLLEACRALVGSAADHGELV